jgi:CRP-like cAMP-binding protein
MEIPVMKNRLLAALPQRDQAIFANLPSVVLDLKQVIYDAGSRLDYIYFIERGVASIIMNLANGEASEIGMIGNEGLVGVSALLGVKTSTQHVVIQVDGCALRMTVDQCQAAFEKSVAFQKLTLRFLESFLNMTAQTAACNRLHSVDKRGDVPLNVANG